jgi:DNA polymerase-3 subunit beta
MRIMAREATPVRLVQKPDALELIAVSQDVGTAHEELDAKYEGAELTVAFNPEYLIDGAEVTPGDEIILESVDALKPALVRSTEGPEFLYLLMPVRVS